MNALRILLIFSLTLDAQDRASELSVRDEGLQRRELQRAKELIYKNHDFSPIQEAFTAKNVELLWHYYTLSFNVPMSRFLGKGQRLSDDELLNLPPERQQQIKMNRDIYEFARDCLLKIPGHASFIGEKIEESVHQRTKWGGLRPTLFACLFSLGQDGSDECIVQIGRFLFDQRDPGFIPLDPATPKRGSMDPRGEHHRVQSNAIGSMLAVIRPRFHVGESWVDERKLPLKGFEEKVQNWWLTSEQAAPYRRSLAATGVVLPPGYPPMKELEGSRCTIAPPLKNPPYPDEEAQPPAPSKQ